jgi:hypothetical protein
MRVPVRISQIEVARWSHEEVLGEPSRVPADLARAYFAVVAELPFLIFLIHEERPGPTVLGHFVERLTRRRG